MRKLLTIDDVMIAFVSALFYGLGWLVPEHLGLPLPLCMVICTAAGGTVDATLNKLVYSEAVQRDPKRRFPIYFSCVLAFLAGELLSLALLGVSLFEDLAGQLAWVIGFPVASFVVTTFLRWLRIRKIRKAYGDGRGGYTFDVSAAELEEINRQNQPILGDYDADLAVRTRTGTYVGERHKKGTYFLGIPYAKPPVGELRWRAPEPLEPTDAVFEAKNLGASAIQVEHKGSVLRHHRQSEDCLYLNIGVGSMKKGEARPVIVLVHHGDFAQGGSADPLLYGTSFIDGHADVVLVTFNYRLGILGFIDFAEVPGGEAYPDAANLGLLDQVAALSWVHENIAAFGGDPDRICVVGFESGAASISLLAATEGASDLFQRALVFFGSVQSVHETPEASRTLARHLMEETHTQTMEELARLDTATLKDAAQRLWLDTCAPTCDGTWIPSNIYEAYQQGSASNIDFIIGIPGNEMGVMRSIMGDERYADWVDATVEDILRHADEPLAQTVRNYVERKAKAVGELEAKASIIDQLYALSMYHAADRLAEAGSGMHLLYWDEEPLIEGLGSGTVDVLATLLANKEAAQMYGAMVNEDLATALRYLLVKFAGGNELKMYPNEVKGIDALEWDPFPQALIVSGHRLSCGTIEDRLTEIDGLPDLLMS